MIAGRAAVQVVGSIVHGQCILLSVEGKLAVLDTVAIAADERAQEGFGRCDYLVDRVVALNHVAQLAIAVGHHDGEQCATVVGEGYLVAQFVGKDEEVGLFTIDIFLKVGLLQARHIVRITNV